MREGEAVQIGFCASRSEIQEDMEAGEMNRELDALRSAVARQHQHELQLLKQHHYEDVAQIEALATTMGNRMNLMERLNANPDESLDLGEQLPRMTQNWAGNGRH